MGNILSLLESDNDSVIPLDVMVDINSRTTMVNECLVNEVTSIEQTLWCMMYALNQPSIAKVDLEPVCRWILNDYQGYKFTNELFINRAVTYTEGMYLVVIAPSSYLCFKHTSKGLELSNDVLQGTSVYATLVNHEQELIDFTKHHSTLETLRLKQIGCCELINLACMYRNKARDVIGTLDTVMPDILTRKALFDIIGTK